MPLAFLTVASGLKVAFKPAYIRVKFRNERGKGRLLTGLTLAVVVEILAAASEPSRGTDKLGHRCCHLESNREDRDGELHFASLCPFY